MSMSICAGARQSYFVYIEVLFRKCEIEGFVFLCSSICNRPFPAIAYLRNWLSRYGDE